MIKEILLSLAIAAFSGVSSFVSSPKKAIETTPVSITLGFDSQYDPDSGEFYLEGNLYTSNYQNPQTFTVDGVSFTCLIYGEFAGEESNFSFELNFTSEGSLARHSLSNVQGISAADLHVTFPSERGVKIGAEGARVETAFENGVLFDFNFDWEVTVPETYQITKNLYNCSINSMPELPNNYQTAQVGQTFVIYGAANSDLAGDYGFNSSSLSVVGASATALSLNNEIGNSGYFRACSFSVTLPANSFTITLRAYRPEFSIVSTLNNCSVSPEIQSSYSGMFAEDFTFTAEQGFYFNKNVTQWEFTGGVVAQEPEYIGLVWGTLYESVKIRLVFDAGNATIRVSGVAYTIDSYQQGWKDGDKSGYDRGHADGLIAGDSYGVWNWLKQAARTTGEFFNIPLLPGFSIGALLTALAGLVIIWFFIKGFLFKS